MSPPSTTTLVTLDEIQSFSQFAELAAKHLSAKLLAGGEDAMRRELYGILPMYLHWHDGRQRRLHQESNAYREVGVWDSHGGKFKTYAPEKLDGVAMYVKVPK